MTEEDDFKKEDLLSIGDLLQDRIRVVKEAREELNKAFRKLDDLVEKKFVQPGEIFHVSENSLFILCRVSSPLHLYFRMVQTGRPLSTGEAITLGESYNIAKESTVLRYLKKLYSSGLIRRAEYGKYMAVPPSRLVQPDVV